MPDHVRSVSDMVEGMKKIVEEPLANTSHVWHNYNLTVFCLQQNFCSIPVPIRRSADMWCIWKSCDNQVVRDISLKTGHSFRTLAKLFIQSPYDFIKFDFSSVKYPLRKNFFFPIQDDGSDSE